MGRSAGIKPRSDAKPQLTAFKRVYRSNHYQEKSGGILTFDIFFSIVTKDCFYCGDKPRRVNPYGKSYETYLKLYSKNPVKEETFNNYFIYAHGIDKIIDQEDYSDLSNLQSCCFTCNFMKRRFGAEFFLNHIAKIYNHQMNKDFWLTSPLTKEEIILCNGSGDEIEWDIE